LRKRFRRQRAGAAKRKTSIHHVSANQNDDEAEAQCSNENKLQTRPKPELAWQRNKKRDYRQISARFYHLLSATHDVTRRCAIAVINDHYLQAAFLAGKLGALAYGFSCLLVCRFFRFLIHFIKSPFVSKRSLRKFALA
jgi:hypothetical protein